MANEVEVIKVKHKTRDWVVINKSDFDPKVHEKYEPKKEAVEEVKPVVKKKKKVVKK